MCLGKPINRCARTAPRYSISTKILPHPAFADEEQISFRRLICQQFLGAPKVGSKSGLDFQDRCFPPSDSHPTRPIPAMRMAKMQYVTAPISEYQGYGSGTGRARLFQELGRGLWGVAIAIRARKADSTDRRNTPLLQVLMMSGRRESEPRRGAKCPRQDDH